MDKVRQIRNREYYTNYREKNREQIKLQQRSWYLNNKDKAKISYKKYRDSGKESEARKKLIEKDPILYKSKALERANKYKICNPEKYRINQRSYQSARRSLGGKIGTKKDLLNFYKNCPKDKEVDHIIPLKNDKICGLHVPWNMQYLTRSDNAVKNNSFDGTYENNGWAVSSAGEE